MANGHYYEGGWRHGKKHGKGVDYYANGDRYESNWQEGVLQGKMLFFPSD